MERERDLGRSDVRGSCSHTPSCVLLFHALLKKKKKKKKSTLAPEGQPAVAMELPGHHGASPSVSSRQQMSDV